MKQPRRWLILSSKLNFNCESLYRKIRNDNGMEFKNHVFDEFLTNIGISYNFSSPHTPQQNGVAERWNRYLCEAARTMWSFAKLPLYFWVDAIATACFTQNRSSINKRFLITPYEILNNHMPNMKFFHIFGSRSLTPKKIVKSLTQKMMKQYFWDIILTQKHIVF